MENVEKKFSSRIHLSLHKLLCKTFYMVIKTTEWINKAILIVNKQCLLNISVDHSPSRQLKKCSPLKK